MRCWRVPIRASLFIPTFDRSRELAIAASAEIKPSEKLVIVEGNYLLFDSPGWRDLAPIWDFSLFIEASLPRLRERLLARWRAQGLSEAAALDKCDGNDLPNAEQVLSRVHKPKVWLISGSTWVSAELISAWALPRSRSAHDELQ